MNASGYIDFDNKMIFVASHKAGPHLTYVRVMGAMILNSKAAVMSYVERLKGGIELVGVVIVTISVVIYFNLRNRKNKGMCLYTC